MPSLFSNGIPKKRDYLSLVESNDFNELKRFSTRFLSINKKNMGKYSRQWVKDPLHQWSRQWEYPYVFSKIQLLAKDNEYAKILDAGSGVTFFPYYIKSRLPSLEIKCTDYDQNLDRVYEQLNAHNKEKVDFSVGDLRKMPYANESFDLVYCISVLEHTNAYTKIIEEFYRVLQPGGTFIITFDLSLDGTRDINIEQGIKLLELLTDKFEFLGSPVDLKSQVNTHEIFTTLSAQELDPSLLPWRLPPVLYRMKSLIAGKGFVSWPPALTIFCASMTKSSH